MPDYLHKGRILDNGQIDFSRPVAGDELDLRPADDALHINPSVTGNFEWWYFDIIDADKDAVIKIVVHLGTDPLRRKIFPQLAISARISGKTEIINKTYVLSDFHATRDFCDVKLKDEFACSMVRPENSGRYSIRVNIPGFRADLYLEKVIDGWKPLNNEIQMERNNRCAAFGWIIPVPMGKATGEINLKDRRLILEKAFAYHDHNFWKVDETRKLFVDDIITKWYWGRFLSDSHSVIFMDTHFKDRAIRSLMFARGRKIIHSSNNLIRVKPDSFAADEILKSRYPGRMEVISKDEAFPFRMGMKKKTMLEGRDLLHDVNPVLAWLIKQLVSRPVYYGILADAEIEIDDEQITGPAVYEMMLFRNK